MENKTTFFGLYRAYRQTTGSWQISAAITSPESHAYHTAQGYTGANEEYIPCVNQQVFLKTEILKPGKITSRVRDTYTNAEGQVLDVRENSWTNSLVSAGESALTMMGPLHFKQKD